MSFSIKKARYEKQFLMALNELLLEKSGEFPFLRNVSVTEIKMSNDYSFATCFVDFLNNEQHNTNLLNDIARKLKHDLLTKLRYPKMPTLIFKVDESLNNYQKIEKILSEVNKPK